MEKEILFKNFNDLPYVRQMAVIKNLNTIDIKKEIEERPSEVWVEIQKQRGVYIPENNPFKS